MYGRSIQHSGIFENADRDDDFPYNNDRLDDAVSLDYSQALSGAIRETSGAYASKIIRSSGKRQNDEKESSGIYASRIGSSRQQNSSTPEPPPRRHLSNAGSGNYAQRIGNLRRSQSDSYYRRHQNENNFNGMNRLGHTMHPNVSENQHLYDKGRYHPPPIMEDDIGLQGLDSPRSTQWPETARSYPLGFEASHVPNNALYLEKSGETSDDDSRGKRKIQRKTSKKQKRRNDRDRNSSDIQTPPWANQLLNKNSSLVGKFRNMREQINKWTLRRFSQKARIPNTDQGPFELLDFPPVTNTESVASLLPTHHDKTNNLALILFGLFLIFILVFPVIVIIVLFTDRSDLVQIKLSMRLNGSITDNFNSNTVEYSLCNQMDIAFSSYDGFYGCDVNEFRNGSIIADISLTFRGSNYPNNILLIEIIEEQFTNKIIDAYPYENNTAVITSYSFVQSRLVSPPPYLRPSTMQITSTITESTTTTTQESPAITTEPPTTTTTTSPTTTEPQTTTTEPPTTTTTEPQTTTKTEPPTTTTTEPSTTTTINPPITTTTEPPSTTTTESPTTTTEPITTTTTEPPSTTIPQITTTTTDPRMTTETSTTTKEPSTSTTESPTTTSEPAVTTGPPTTITESPTSSTEALTTTTQQANTTTDSPTTS